MPVSVEAAPGRGAAAGAEIVSVQPRRKPAGTLIAVGGEGGGGGGAAAGLAHVRLALALQLRRPGSAADAAAADSGNLLHVMHAGADGEVEAARVRPSRPPWWPDSWGREEL